MREIIFRAWDKKANRMLLISDDRAISFLGKPMECVGSNDSGDQWDLARDWEIMQYTGLKDKNGKKIFEGDIANINQMVDTVWITERGVMEFRKEYAQFGFNIHNSWLAENKDISNVEIVGNIYENPELLTPKEPQ